MNIRLLLVRILAVPAALIGLFIIYDALIAPAETDDARITSKYISYGKHTSYHLKAIGRIAYGSNVPCSFYNSCSRGDSIQLAVTPYFKEWRHVCLTRDGVIVAEATPSDRIAMAVMAALFALTPLVFLPYFQSRLAETEFRDRKRVSRVWQIWLMALILEIVAIVVAIGIFLVKGLKL